MYASIPESFLNVLRYPDKLSKPYDMFEDSDFTARQVLLPIDVELDEFEDPTVEESPDTVDISTVFKEATAAEPMFKEIDLSGFDDFLSDLSLDKAAATIPPNKPLVVPGGFLKPEDKSLDFIEDAFIDEPEVLEEEEEVSPLKVDDSKPEEYEHLRGIPYVYWTALGLRITSMVVQKSKFAPIYVIAGCTGIKDNQPVSVQVPFNKFYINDDILKQLTWWANRDRITLRLVGAFEALMQGIAKAK